MTLDRTERKLYLAATDGLGALLYHAVNGYGRALRWYGAKGLSDKERAYADKRLALISRCADDMAKLRTKVYHDLNGVKGNPQRRR